MVRILNPINGIIFFPVLYMLGVKAFRFAILLLFIGFFQDQPVGKLVLAGYILCSTDLGIPIRISK